MFHIPCFRYELPRSTTYNYMDPIWNRFTLCDINRCLPLYLSINHLRPENCETFREKKNKNVFLSVFCIHSNETNPFWNGKFLSNLNDILIRFQLIQFHFVYITKCSAFSAHYITMKT